MSIREFVQKYFERYGVTYASLHRLIRIGALKENIHYTKSYRAIRARILVNESRLVQYLETGR